MKIALIIIGVLIVLVILLICIYTYHGGFRKISFNIEHQGGEVVVYEDVVGDYKHTSKYTDRIYYSLLNNEKIETTRGIGIFYDNPQKVDKESLRSDVGCIIENADSATIAQLSDNYLVKTLPESNFIVIEFPYKNPMSIMIGIMKVYPTLDKYSEEHGFKDSPITEIYDVPNMKIVYRKEVIR